MPRWILPFFVFIALIIVLEIYAFQAFKTISKSKLVRFSFLAISLAVYVYFVITILSYKRSDGQTPQFQMAMGLLLTVSIPKLIIIFLLFGEDLYRVTLKLFSTISTSETKPLASRRKFISQLAIAIAALPFASFIYGIIQGKYNYKIIKYRLSFDDLPEAFDGFTETVLEVDTGRTITKVDDDSYTFTASSGTATVGDIRGGGGFASAGPVTLSA